MSSAGGLVRPIPGQSLSGHPLEGHNIVRMIYLDDAGLSNPLQEPFVVVAGVMVDADRQWLELERHLEALADTHAPPERRDEFFFHATELFSGGGFFPRDKYPREERWKILDELMAVPKKFKLPIVAGWVERAKLAEKFPNLDRATLTVHAQSIAYMICTYAADLYMRKGKDVREGEVATIVMENNNQARKQIAAMHMFNRNPKNAEVLYSYKLGDLVLKRIIGSPHFEQKGQSSPLQLGDVCAFAIKRHLMRTPESARFYAPIQRGMVILDKSELDASGKPIPVTWTWNG